MIMWHNLQTQHCILLLVNQPGINAAAVFSFKIAESTSIWQRASYHRITKLVEGLGIMEVFQNSPQPLHFTAFVVVTLLALPLCPCMYPFTSSAVRRASTSLHAPLLPGFIHCPTAAAGEPCMVVRWCLWQAYQPRINWELCGALVKSAAAALIIKSTIYTMPDPHCVLPCKLICCGSCLSKQP